MMSLRKNVNDVFGLECKRCYQVVPPPSPLFQRGDLKTGATREKT